MNTELTQKDRITGFLALLDDVIKKDEERTQGEWQAWQHDANNEWSHSRIRAQTHRNLAIINSGHPDAAFIASASVSHGRNARALREQVMQLQFAITDYQTAAKGTHANFVWEFAKNALNSILSLYPDEILKRYLP